jgi:hypothetical protein
VTDISTVMGIRMMNFCGFVKLFSTPMMLGMFSVPGVSVPVMATTPIPPMPMEVTVVYAVISWRHPENIVRWYNRDSRWDKRCLDISPGSVIDVGPEPVISMEAIPVASEEIKACRARNQIDITLFTGDYDDIGRCWKRQKRGRRNADANVHLGRTNKRHADNKE